MKALDIVKRAVEIHERMRGAYFWTPDATASGRRHCEQRNSLRAAFRWRNRRYEIDLSTTCSCRNVYYRATIRVDGERKDIRALKALL
jgi:hypothetical protein